MTPDGYYRFPTLHGDTVVFVCEDDLWQAQIDGGVARRLTSNPGQATSPSLSPDGRLLAFSGKDEGSPEIFLMSAAGGPAERLTYLGSDSRVVGWSSDGASVLFASNSAQPFMRTYNLYSVSCDGGQPERLPTGPAVSISHGPDGAAVIGRYTTDIARWKRYRGGLTGDLWVDESGDGQWRRLVQLPGNVAMPLWVGDRIYFVSDHEGIGNLYSCTSGGEEVTRHTNHNDFYARHPATDGTRIVYHAGGDLFLFQPDSGESRRIDVDLRSPRVQRKRKFVAAGRYLQDYALHPRGRGIAAVSRGKTFTMANWEGAPVQHGDSPGARHRLATWMSDGQRLVVVSDASGEEALEIHHADTDKPAEMLDGVDVGRPLSLAACPKTNRVALTNHRHELLVVDLDDKSVVQVDRSSYERIMGMSWSPDGQWLAYGFSDTRRTSVIRLWHADDGEVHDATRPVLYDYNPSFDPDGKHLYFLSYRDFNPVYDSLHFDLNFPRGSRPYLITLQAGLPSPFDPVPRAPGEKPGQGAEDKGGDNNDGNDGGDDDGTDDGKESSKHSAPQESTDEKPTESDGPDTDEGADKEKDGSKGKGGKPVRIDLEGLPDRILRFPVPEGRYGQVRGIHGQALFTCSPIVGALTDAGPGESPPRAWLESFRFDDLRQQTLAREVSGFDVSADAKTLIYRSGGRLRVVKAGDKLPSNDDAPGRKSGWLDLGRLSVPVEPGGEWEQMFREAWRLQREHFWTEDMSGIDWKQVYDRYLPLVERIATRGEFSDLMWEMQGELGTSHAYEFGGDYRPEPNYGIGFLGADFVYDQATDSYRVARLVSGDPWNPKLSSPLVRAGVDVKVGDRLVAVGGRELSLDLPPGELLMNLAATEVYLTFERDEPLEGDSVSSTATSDGKAAEQKVSDDAQVDEGIGEHVDEQMGEQAGQPVAEEGGDAGGPARKSFTVRTLSSERRARYRDWVDSNRAWVHEATGGRVGYVHIPDMSAAGYAEFHRGFLTELDREGLIVDVRFNGGGHVSQLILEKLARRRIGYDVTRWGEPMPYPHDSVLGRLVALTNEQAGSDGDMFSHAFKMMELGPLIGTRTWGGVVGINMRNSLVDGGMTTQPEYSFWFQDVEWGLENYGTDPDIEVEIRPQDHVAGVDPQLSRGVEVALELIAEEPPKLPEFGNRPRLSLPKLSD